MLQHFPSRFSRWENLKINPNKGMKWINDKLQVTLKKNLQNQLFAHVLQNSLKAWKQLY